MGRSKLVQLYEHGDIVMADKCFNVHDLFAMMDAAVNISTLKKKGNSISGKITYEIVYKRVHIASIIDLELNCHHIKHFAVSCSVILEHVVFQKMIE